MPALLPPKGLFTSPEYPIHSAGIHTLIADRMNGQPLSPRDSPLRLLLPSEKRETRWVRMVERIEIQAAPEPVR